MKAGRQLILYAGLVLLAFWVIISETFHWQHLLVGAVIAASVAVFNRSLIEALELSRYRTAGIVLVVVMLGRLIRDMVRANIQVAQIVLSPRMPIDPHVVDFGTGLKPALSRALLANAITLTPGTLTIDVDGDRFVVHCLTEHNARAVSHWRLIEEFKQLEG
ncbi:MAG: Na+/H+ antiporter subunit E [Bacillota bacterium]